MVWTAPEFSRRHRPATADERTALEDNLDGQRETLLWRCAGLTGADLVRRPIGWSSLSLLGIVRHLAEAERLWFRRRFAGEDVPYIFFSESDPDRDFDRLDPAGAAADFAAYTVEVEQARQATLGRSLDDSFLGPDGELVNLRWLYLHMIEKYARHNGHAELIRQAIDDEAGD